MSLLRVTFRPLLYSYMSINLNMNLATKTANREGKVRTGPAVGVHGFVMNEIKYS